MQRTVSKHLTSMSSMITKSGMTGRSPQLDIPADRDFTELLPEYLIVGDYKGWTGLSLPCHLPLCSKDNRISADLRIPEHHARVIGNNS